jgi:hypothetical protein
MRNRIATTALFTTLLSLALTAPAMAEGFGKGSGAGEGALGETNDKVVTFFCLGVLLFFVLTVIVGTMIQNALQKRHDAHDAMQRRQRVGW